MHVFNFTFQDKQLYKHDRDECNKMYTEILEKIFNAFDRIPNCIKEKFPGFDNRTYAKLKLYKSKLKHAIEKSEKDVETYVDNSLTQLPDSPSVNYMNNLSNGSESPSLMNHNDIDDFDLASSQVYGKKPYDYDMDKQTSDSIETSTPDFSNLNKNSVPGKTTYSDLLAKKALSFDAFSPCNDSSKNLETSYQSEAEKSTDNINKSKGKFVFKKPSRLSDDAKTTPLRDVPSSTLEKFKKASEVLKPIETVTESPKSSTVLNSSEKFQPPQLLSKNSLMNFNKPCTVVSPIIKDSNQDDEIDDYEVPVDMDDVDDILPESQSIINISDSIPSTSAMMENKDIPVDVDGWPEYRIEDFEDDIEALTSKGEEVLNLMDQSVAEDRPKYEGMGDFHAGTKNDGITGNLPLVLFSLFLCSVLTN